jgi:outer membrane protein assembly factor BamB
MSWRLRLLVLAPVFLFVMGALVESCTSSGSGFVAVPQPGPGFALDSISVCEGPAATPTPTPSVTPKPGKATPTVTPCPGISSTSVPAPQVTVSLHADGFFTKGKKAETLDITNSAGTLWTSSDPAVLEPPGAGQGGEYFAVAAGRCACANASSGGITSPPVLVAIATPVAACTIICPTPLPTPTATPKAAVTASATRLDLTAPQSSGVMLWAHDTGGPIAAQIATGLDGGAYFVTRDGTLHALDSRGQSVFTRPGVSTAAPVVGSDGTIYVSGASGDVFALAPDGSTRWRAGLTGRATPLVALGSTIVVRSSGELITLDGAGTTSWSLPMPDRIVAATLTADGFAVESAHAVTAISADGVIQWSFAVPGGTAGTLGASESALYAGSHDGTLYALDAGTGAELWHLETPATVAAGPSVAPSGTIYVASDALYALSSDGQVLWTGAVPGGPAKALAALDSGGVFVASDDAAAAISSAGALIWSARSFGAVDSVAASPNGVVYVASRSGRMFAMR